MTKLFLDSGDPKATERVLAAGIPLAGQTTNPSLIAKAPGAQGKTFSQNELLAFYKDTVQKIGALLPDGSISIEVHADHHTSAEEMLEQAVACGRWIPNAHIKFPTTIQGVQAAILALEHNVRVNMTLVFSQEQAAAVYAATRGAVRGSVYLSPFLGRLDDVGKSGLDVLQGILQMYAKGDGHVEVLAASLRSVDHLRSVIALGADLATAPEQVLLDWQRAGSPMDAADLDPELQHVTPKRLDLDQPWSTFNLHHDLTDKGLDRFARDWESLLK